VVQQGGAHQRHDGADALVTDALDLGDGHVSSSPCRRPGREPACSWHNKRQRRCRCLSRLQVGCLRSCGHNRGTGSSRPRKPPIHPRHVGQHSGSAQPGGAPGELTS
jgi:hypothetical protein